MVMSAAKVLISGKPEAVGWVEPFARPNAHGTTLGLAKGSTQPADSTQPTGYS